MTAAGRLPKASPWPFVGMTGLACALFLYAASVLFAPWWVVTLLILAWLGLLLLAAAWWTPHPTRLPWVAVAAFVLWAGAVALVSL